MYTLRTLLIYLLFLLTTPYGWYLKYTKKKKSAQKYLYKYAKIINKTAGNNLEIIGIDNLETIQGETYLMVSNHQGYFDIINIVASHQNTPGFVAKSDLKKIPGLTLWNNIIDSVFLDRDNPRQAIKDMKKVEKNLNQKKNMIIFPAGTRSIERKKFNSTAFKIAKKTKVTLIPTTLIGTYKVLEENKKITKTKTKLIYHKPIRYNDYKEMDIKSLTKRCEDIVYKGYDENL